MIRHPLIRCGLFVVAYLLAIFLLSSFRGSFYWNVVMNQLAVFIATGVMLVADRRWPDFVGLSLCPGWEHSTRVAVVLVFGFRYLRKGRLWLRTAGHWGGSPADPTSGFAVSGINLPGLPFEASITGSPLWAGGAYGPEAGLPATIVLLAG